MACSLKNISTVSPMTKTSSVSPNYLIDRQSLEWHGEGRDYLSNTFILKFIIFFFLFIRLTSKT